MRLKVFTFRFSSEADGFDDSPMQAFIADKEVIECRDHFFVHENTRYLTVILSYRMAASAEKGRPVREDLGKELEKKSLTLAPDLYRHLPGKYASARSGW